MTKNTTKIGRFRNRKARWEAFATRSLGACALLAAIASSACVADDDDDDRPPIVAFLTSYDRVVDSDVATRIHAADDDGVVSVELYFHNQRVGGSEVAPFTIEWSADGLDEGVGSLKAVATDTAGQQSTAEVEIEVKHAPAAGGPTRR